MVLFSRTAAETSSSWGSFLLQSETRDEAQGVGVWGSLRSLTAGIY